MGKDTLSEFRLQINWTRPPTAIRNRIDVEDYSTGFGNFRRAPCLFDASRSRDRTVDRLQPILKMGTLSAGLCVRYWFFG